MIVNACFVVVVVVVVVSVNFVSVITITACFLILGCTVAITRSEAILKQNDKN